MNIDNNEEDGDESKVEKGVNKNSCTTGLEVTKLETP